MEVLTGVFAQFGALAGVAAFITLLINVLKAAGIVPDGQAANVSAGLNLVGVATLLALKVFKPDFDVAGVDANAAEFAKVATVVFAYVMSVGGSKLFYQGVKGVKLIGKSNSE